MPKSRDSLRFGELYGEIENRGGSSGNVSITLWRIKMYIFADEIIVTYW